MSFDPQNPRGAQRPTQPPTNKSAANYIPPQPVNPGPSRLLIAGGAAIGILAVGIIILLALNLLKSPAASPAPSSTAHVASPAAPTIAGSPRASSVPSAGSTTRASTPPTPGSSTVAPGSGLAALLAHIPEAIRGTCTINDAEASILASASCTAGSSAISVTYDQYPEATSMDAAYEDIFGQQQIDAGTGSCEDHNTWPAEGPYQIENEPAGRRLCADQAGSSTIYWTDDRLTILSTASAADAAALVQFWTNEAGPIQ